MALQDAFPKRPMNAFMKYFNEKRSDVSASIKGTRESQHRAQRSGGAWALPRHMAHARSNADLRPQRPVVEPAGVKSRSLARSRPR